MAAIIASVGTAAEGAGTVSCPPPSGISNGDLLIGIVAGLYQDSTSNAALSGWTHKHTFVTAETRLSVLYKYASGESGNYDFAMSGALFTSGVVLRVTGAVTVGDPFSAIGAGSTGSSTTPTAASISPADTDTLLLWVATWVNAGTTLSGDPAGMTERVEATILSVFSEANASSGATGTRAGTISASEDWGAILMAISSAGSGTSTTVTPAQSALTLNGRAATTSAFQNVRIREVLINGSGQTVGNAQDITLLVWYSGRFGGAPDVSINGLTTDANGTTSWSIATGTLAFNDPVAWVAQNSISLSHYAAARMVPSYE